MSKSARPADFEHPSWLQKGLTNRYALGRLTAMLTTTKTTKQTKTTTPTTKPGRTMVCVQGVA